MPEFMITPAAYQTMVVRAKANDKSQVSYTRRKIDRLVTQFERTGIAGIRLEMPDQPRTVKVRTDMPNGLQSAIDACSALGYGPGFILEVALANRGSYVAPEASTAKPDHMPIKRTIVQKFFALFSR